MSQSLDNDTNIPKGLVLFSGEMSDKRKFRRIIFIFVAILATFALIWPFYPFFSGVYPLILGLPLSLFWVVFWLIIVLIALVWLFNSGDSKKID